MHGSKAGGCMFSDIQLLQIKNTVTRILHAPGNYNGGILEMAVVVDCHIPAAELQETCKRIAQMLKKDETFRNVRLNLLKWAGDDAIEKEVIPMAFLLTGSAFANERNCPAEAMDATGDIKAESLRQEQPLKTLDELFRQLKLFYARSKVVLVLTDGSYKIADKQTVKTHLQPFLSRKLLLLQNGEQITGTQLLLKLV